MRRSAVVLAVAVAVAASVSAVLASSGASEALPQLGPASIAYNGDVGDPYLASQGRGAATSYTLFATDDWPAHIPTASSPDLHTWRPGPDALPTLPSWADPDLRNSKTWAPAALQIGSRYLLYVSVVESASNRHCIAVTAASTALGPYTDARGSPLVCQRDRGGSIDPSVARDPHGGLHLLWKNDGNCCNLPAGLWSQDLRPDGTGVTGAPHLLLTADRRWQAGVVENPAAIPASKGGWWLFYSGNHFDRSGYATGLAYCPTLRGPCRETSNGPFLSGTAHQFSPGGMDFFTDSQGRLWASFATWSRPARNGIFYCCRPLTIARVLRS